MKRKLLTILLILFLIQGVPVKVFAHGVEITYQTKSAIEITATFDTGEPVSEGQVVIYAPNNPSTPWSTGKCDENGRFTFAPDPSKPGIWDVQVRRAGHGGMVHIPVGEDATAAAGSSGYTTSQIVLMAACAIWGFVGTALFFLRRKN
ncbi:hypothetical protein P378_14985 [Desulforamulus profundi]|uniref:Carboxypeptidase regulatory-like domain-containing protein n=1 Tax=Desulforamulus profundi TaxID=1383067 RepID=A0A2C6LH25_9FIRM|nr:hypothetical protein [Desulforamulus profundi]PHJ37560.1 hypothetical protein P378_14985 [Desulforamulus profundi]